MTMTTPQLLILTAAILMPLSAPAASKSKGGGAGLPPKFGGLIQLAPEAPGEAQPSLITSELSGLDLEFLTHTIELGRLQSWLVTLAQDKAESPEVRSLGGALAGIQADENKFVAKLAAAKGVVVPSSKTPVGEQKKIAAQLAKQSGAKLEKALMEEIVTAAQKSVTEYEAGMKSKDADIKRLAEQMLPAAKSRLQFASKASGRAQDTSDKPNFRVSTPAPKSSATPPPKSAAATPSPTAPPNLKATPAATPTPKPAATPPPGLVEKAAEAAKSIPGITAATPPVGPAPPHPPKPTPVSQGAVIPKSPTPPDFSTPAPRAK